MQKTKAKIILQDLERGVQGGSGEGGGTHEEERERNRGKMKNEDFFLFRNAVTSNNQRTKCPMFIPQLGFKLMPFQGIQIQIED